MALVAVYDANVLYPSTLRDVLIRAGLARLVQPKWTDEILDETFRNLRMNRPDLSNRQLERTRRLMTAAVRDVLVTGFHARITGISLPDPDDRHVVAAAIHCGATVIVTKNLRDFPASALSPLDIDARHPDAFLYDVQQQHPDDMRRIILDIASTWLPLGTPTQVLASLAKDAPRTAQEIQESLP